MNLIMRLWNRLFGPDPVRWNHRYVDFRMPRWGHRVTLDQTSGCFADGHGPIDQEPLKVGDAVLLKNEHLYLIEHINYMSDPSDQFFATVRDIGTLADLASDDQD